VLFQICEIQKRFFVMGSVLDPSFSRLARRKDSLYAFGL
jgi:hypothetical protein